MFLAIINDTYAEVGVLVCFYSVLIMRLILILIIIIIFNIAGFIIVINRILIFLSFIYRNNCLFIEIIFYYCLLSFINYVHYYY